MREIAAGNDPLEAKAAPTMTDLAGRFLTEHAAIKCKPRTAAEYRRLFDTIILPALERRTVKDITRVDITRMHHDLR